MKRLAILLLIQSWMTILATEQPKQKVPRYPNEVVEVAWRNDLIPQANRELKIDKFEIEDATFEEALEYLRVRYARGRPGEFGLNMEFKGTQTEKSKITLKLDKPTPFFEVLDRMCQQAGYYWKVGLRSVEISTKEIISQKTPEP